MVIIAFSNKTSKIIPRIFCRHFRHCAPIIPMHNVDGKPFAMYQFVCHGRVVKIPLNVRDMNLLRRAGWVFINVNATHKNVAQCVRTARTCVDLSRRIIGWRGCILQTPYGLYRQLIKLI